MKSKPSSDEFEKIYERYKDTLYRIAFSYMNNNHDVQDILQEVFVRRLYKAPAFESDTHEKNWMIRITINLCKNTLKSYWRKNVGTMEDVSEANDVAQFDFSERETEIYNLIMSLPDKQRDVIFLYYYEDYSVCRNIYNEYRWTR